MTDMVGRGGGIGAVLVGVFWVVLSSRGLAPVDVDVEAEGRIRAGNPHLSGPGLLHYGHLSFPLSPECRQQGTYVKTQLLRGTRTRAGTTRISLLFRVLY